MYLSRLPPLTIKKFSKKSCVKKNDVFVKILFLLCLIIISEKSLRPSSETAKNTRPRSLCRSAFSCPSEGTMSQNTVFSHTQTLYGHNPGAGGAQSDEMRTSAFMFGQALWVTQDTNRRQSFLLCAPEGREGRCSVTLQESCSPECARPSV